MVAAPLLLAGEDNFLILILPIFSGYTSEPLIINTQTVTQQIKVQTRDGFIAKTKARKEEKGPPEVNQIRPKS